MIWSIWGNLDEHLSCPSNGRMLVIWLASVSPKLSQNYDQGKREKLMKPRQLERQKSLISFMPASKACMCMQLNCSNAMIIIKRMKIAPHRESAANLTSNKSGFAVKNEIGSQNFPSKRQAPSRMHKNMRKGWAED